VNALDDDLLPIFLGEAQERLDTLATLLSAGLDDPEAVIGARRELHALKGASRMMGLTEFSSLCHEGEELLERPDSGAIREAVVIHDRLVRLLGSLEQAPPERGRGGERGAPAAGGRSTRLGDDALDLLADRGARLRVMAVGAAGLVDRMFRLARLAERGVTEAEPRQVLAALATSIRSFGMEFEAGQRRIQWLAEGLLETLLREQVRPLRPVLEQLARHARSLADALGKEIEVSAGGDDAVLDRRTIRALQEAFLHIVRNAVDHGIEAPEERIASGKRSRGRISLDARTDGGRVRFEVRDDGRGIDIEALSAAAVERARLDPEEIAALGRDEVLQLLCLPGVTTRDDVSELSGRGIGLDAVAATVRRLGGDIWFQSQEGRGTTVSVELPVTRRGERALVLEVGGCQVALPAAPVRGYRRMDSAQLSTEGQRTLTSIGGEKATVRVLATLLGRPPAESSVVVEATVGGGPLAVIADSVVGEEEIFVRPAAGGVGMPTVFDGITVLASGRPAPVLSWQQLAPVHGFGLQAAADTGRSRRLRVLLVDDSRVTREMIRRLLEDASFDVRPVGSAQEALGVLRESEIDCLVTDIEMPALDGLALTRKLRAERRFADLPIIVVSTRNRPSDHRAGLDAGADAYLSKQSLEARELISLIRRVGGVS
jgi:chemotaxis protein histidine kinase CheA/CheY-like chemotaxis protein